LQAVDKAAYACVYGSGGEHVLMNGDARIDESGFISSTPAPRLPAAAAAGGLQPTAPPRSSLSSNASSESSQL